LSRARKLLIVGLVLAMGMGLAWPFRKSGSSTAPGGPHGTQAFEASDSLAIVPSLPKQQPTQSSGQRHTAAKMASTGETAITPTREPNAFPVSHDLANHPALANQPATQPATPTDLLTTSKQGSAEQEKPTSRPAYATAKEVSTPAAEQEEILHIVCNTDTLEKLAKRYLGDAGRALELFDLNRDQLTNPHLLPIGAKLRIPVAPERDLD